MGGIGSGRTPGRGSLYREIYNIIRSENGIRTSEIASKLHVTRDCAAGHVQQLRNEGLIYGKGVPGFAYNWYESKEYDSMWRIQNDANRWERYY